MDKARFFCFPQGIHYFFVFLWRRNFEMPVPALPAQVNWGHCARLGSAGEVRNLYLVLAGAEGFEPSDDGTKPRCLTSLATPQRLPDHVGTVVQHDNSWQYVRIPFA